MILKILKVKIKKDKEERNKENKIVMSIKMKEK